MRQYFQGIPIFGHQVIVTSRGGKAERINEKLIKGIADDIQDVVPSFDFATALNLVKREMKSRLDRATAWQYKNVKTELVIYVGDDDIARLAYFVPFFADTKEGGNPTRPHYIIDAKTREVLKQWEGLTHSEIGKGPGGNIKTGQYEYGTDFGFLDVEASGSACTMYNQNVKTVDLYHGTRLYQ